MRKILLFIVFFPSFLFAQKTLKLADFSEIAFVSEMPADKLPKGGKDIVFLQSYSDTGSVMYVGYTINEEEAKILTQFQQDAEWFNSTKSNASFSNDTITLWTQQPFRATEITYTVLYKNKKAKFISSEWDDPSATSIELAEKALAEGKIQEAINYYYEVQYPSSYINENEVGMQILSKASELAFSSSKNKNYPEAVQYIQTAFQYYTLSSFTEPADEAALNQVFEDTYMTEYKDSFGLWMGNYGYYLYKADSLEQSIVINSQLNSTYPQLSGPFLQHADALYDLNRKSTAKSIYLKYIALMRAKGKENHIPARIHERVK